MLARQGMMGEVGEAYTAVRTQVRSRRPMPWSDIRTTLQQ
jgi:hypothetical protein